MIKLFTFKPAWFLIVFFIMFSFRVNAQSNYFQKTFDTLGCYNANDIITYFDNSYYVCGSSYTSNANDAVVLHLDSSGNLIWINTYSTVFLDGAMNVAISSDSNLIVAGVMNLQTAEDSKLWLSKITPSGATLWSYTYQICGASQPFDLITLKNGGFALTGECVTPGNSSDVMLIKFNDCGQIIWTKIFNYFPGDVAKSLAELDNGYFIVAGGTGRNGIVSAYVIKTDSYGDTLWTKTYGNNGFEFFESVKVASDSFLVFTGYSYDTIQNNYNVYLVKTDLEGNLIWEKFIGNNYENTGADLIIQGDEYYIAGTTNSIQRYEFLLIKTDSSGDTIWTHEFGGPGSQVLSSFSSTDDRGFIMAGYDGLNGQKILVIKTDSIGTTIQNIENTESIQPLNFYPNPASNKITISNLPLNSKIEIISAIGESISIYQNPNDEISIDTSNLPSGTYYFKVLIDNYFYCKPFIVIH